MKRFIPLLILFSAFFIRPASSQVDTVSNQYAAVDTQNVNIRLFDSDSLIEIALRFDITAYRKQKSDVDYLPAVLTYYSGKKDSVNKNIKLRARGEYASHVLRFSSDKLKFQTKRYSVN